MALKQKKKRLFILALFVITIFLMLSSNIPLAARMVFNVPQFSQQPYSYICWATTASMIIAYFKGDTYDRDVAIAKEKYGSNFNQPAPFSDVEYFVRKYTGRAGSIKATYLSWTAVQYQINRGGPIGTRIAWKNGGGGHAEVIKGYDSGTGWVIYNDPWDGLGHGCTYSFYVNNPYWYWTHSLFYY